MKSRLALLLAMALVTPKAGAQFVPEELGPAAFTTLGHDRTSADEIAPGVFRAVGFGNTFRVVTSEGDVIVDTSIPTTAPIHKRLLDEVSEGAIRYIVITHAHGDHTGGVGLWRGEGTEVIAHQSSVEFLHYQKRLEGFFNRRNMAQFTGQQIPIGEPKPVENYAGEILATVLTDDAYGFELGGRKFEVLHAPGETPDAVLLWLPDDRIIFTGDLYYDSFPNIYTLRGTRPRWALDYVESVNKVLELEPELLVPSHGDPIEGAENIRSTLTKYRDAIQYVHDATVEGMNAGKDVQTLMREITLPPELAMNESYGRVSWSVRGIYQGYVGWFTGNPAMMYSAEPVSKTLVELAGGADAVAISARNAFEQGDVMLSLNLIDAALSHDSDNVEALTLQVEALGLLKGQVTSAIEVGWLNYGIAQAQSRLEALD